jgi:hypothetical protein
MNKMLYELDEKTPIDVLTKRASALINGNPLNYSLLTQN